MPKNKKTIKVRDLKPSKDAKGGGHHAAQGFGAQGTSTQGTSTQGHQTQHGVHHNQ